MRKSILIILALLILTACREAPKERTMKINITTLATQGLEGDLQKGVSAVYAALIGEDLLVAGGAISLTNSVLKGAKKCFTRQYFTLIKIKINGRR